MEGSTCGICREDTPCDFETRCGHFFHKEWLRSWLKITQVASECPYCRCTISGSLRVERLFKEILKGNFSSLDSIERADANDFLYEMIYDERMPFKLIIEKCMTKGWRVNDDFNFMVMHVAETNRIDLLEYLLSLGADLNENNFEQGSPLHYACANGELEMVKFLISKGLNPNTPDGEFLETPLYDAIRSNNYEVVKYMIETGSRLDVVNKDGMNPVAAVILENVDFSILELLYEKGALDSVDHCFYLACKYNNVDYADYFYEKGANMYYVSAEGLTSLHIAAKEDSVDTLEYLLGLGADINVRDSDDDTPLITAAIRGATGTLRLLIDNGADLNIVSGGTYWTAIQIACHKGKFDAAEMLFHAGVDVMLKTAYRQDMLESLLRRPDMLYKVLEKDVNREAPILHAICNTDNYDMLVEYIYKGYDVSAFNFFGHSPLFFVRNKRMIGKLLEESIDINLKDRNGRTAFMMACNLGNKNLFEMLIDHPNCDVNCVSIDNQNALHLAINSGKYDLVSPLIKRGVDVNLVDKNGYNPVGLLPMILESKYRQKDKDEPVILNIIEEMKEADAVFLAPSAECRTRIGMNITDPIFIAYMSVCEEQNTRNRNSLI